MRHLTNESLEDGIVESALALLAEGAGRVEALERSRPGTLTTLADWVREAEMVLETADGADEQ